jgi:hypothetical protein
MLEAIATGQWPAPANTEAAEEQKKPVASTKGLDPSVIAAD